MFVELDPVIHQPIEMPLAPTRQDSLLAQYPHSAHDWPSRQVRDGSRQPDSLWAERRISVENMTVRSQRTEGVPLEKGVSMLPETKDGIGSN